MDQFELHRQTDGLIYAFTRTGRHRFTRRDNPHMTINWEGPWGWTARLPENGVLAGTPLGNLARTPERKRAPLRRLGQREGRSKLHLPSGAAMTCAFCEIAAGRAAAHFLYEDAEICAICRQLAHSARACADHPARAF